MMYRTINSPENSLEIILFSLIWAKLQSKSKSMVPFHVGHHLVGIFLVTHTTLWCIGSAIVLLHPPIHRTRTEITRNVLVRNLANEVWLDGSTGWQTKYKQEICDIMGWLSTCTHTHKEYTTIEILCCIEPTVKPRIPEFHAEFLCKMFSTVCVFVIDTPN